jgi:hypothetical protein
MVFTEFAEEKRQMHGKSGIGNRPRKINELRRHPWQFVHHEDIRA